MKVYRVEHSRCGLGPFMGPKSSSLNNYMSTLIDQDYFPISEFDDKFGHDDYFGVATLQGIIQWFATIPELIQMLHDEGYHIAIYRTKSISYKDKNQLTFRISSAKLVKILSLETLHDHQDLHERIHQDEITD